VRIENQIKPEPMVNSSNIRRHSVSAGSLLVQPRDFHDNNDYIGTADDYDNFANHDSFYDTQSNGDDGSSDSDHVTGVRQPIRDWKNYNCRPGGQF
jgi:hypothetical protein